jgi:hypothetical protein
VQLQRHAVVPLRVRHLEQINLRYRSRDIEQCIDSAKAFEYAFDQDLRRLRFPKVESPDHRFGARAPYVGGGFLQLVLIPRNQHND